jgi:hypothetical protein
LKILICFESTERGQNVIRENGKLNGVADKILIYGIAEKDFYKVIPDEQLRNSVLLILRAEILIFLIRILSKFSKTRLFLSSYTIGILKMQIINYKNLDKMR